MALVTGAATNIIFTVRTFALIIFIFGIPNKGHVCVCTVAATCGGKLTATGSRKYVTSLGYPTAYDAFTRCTWTIKGPQKNNIITVKVCSCY